MPNLDIIIAGALILAVLCGGWALGAGRAAAADDRAHESEQQRDWDWPARS